MQVDVPNPKTPPPGPSGILTPEETPAKRPHLQGQQPTMAHSASEMQMAPASNPGASGDPVVAMDQSISPDGEASAASTGQGQTGAGHALTRILRAPGYPTGDSGSIYKVRHRIPIQLEPEVPRNFFYHNLTADGATTDIPFNSSQAFLFSGWLAIPVSSLSLYMNDKEIFHMYRNYMAYRYLSAGARMSNFQTHSVLPTGQDSPGFALNNSGVTFYSVQLNSREINYPWLLGSQQYPLSRIVLDGNNLGQTPRAFDDGDGVTLSPEFNLRPRNIMPTKWWLWWLANVDVVDKNTFSAPTTAAVAKMDGFSAIPDLQRLALEQQNSPAHCAWFHRFNAEKQWRSKNTMAQMPNQLFCKLNPTDSVKSNNVFTNARFIRRDINVPFAANGLATLTQQQPVYITHYGMMCSGMQARGPPTWNSFYERIFSIDDCPLQKYGDAFTFVDQNQTNTRAAVQSNFAVNGQGYGMKGIKDLWAIAWRVPNDPSGTPVPLTIEFVMETQIDVECKHFDSSCDLNQILCRPDGTFATNSAVDTSGLSIDGYNTYLKERGYNYGFQTNNNSQNGALMIRGVAETYMTPKSAFTTHIALESDNLLQRLDGCVNPDGQTNYGYGFEGQNLLNRSAFGVKDCIDRLNNTNNLEGMFSSYQGNCSTALPH